ncbi:MAG: ACT domain-containing protein [Oscillospiraceae bacterium]|nr:ACT domain-containing protein [Oscillospiraceae bacterium]
MSEEYLIIHKSVLPDYYAKVLEARRLLESGKVREVSEAARMAGISRSTYYKYKDHVFEPAEASGSRKAVLELMLDHQPGVLSAVLSRLFGAGANILTITQSLPVLGKASVTLTIDVGGVSRGISSLVSALESVGGVESVRLLAIE